MTQVIYISRACLSRGSHRKHKLVFLTVNAFRWQQWNKRNEKVEDKLGVGPPSLPSNEKLRNIGIYDLNIGIYDFPKGDPRLSYKKTIESSGDKLVVLNFYADWCDSCMELEGTVKALARKYSSKAVIIKIDEDHFVNLAERYKIDIIPTFIFLKKKHRLASYSGTNKIMLTRMMARLVKS
ncbi:thioredoxin-1-like [Drosophila ficusphila]|uniref:thioredoxin-1-like n=1 Tax=Drosophila ficusphila TaxID=30025 RepID=UPI0007E6EC0D|nr:thioredoxin-1-like [Drosophila ficusphila]